MIIYESIEGRRAGGCLNIKLTLMTKSDDKIVEFI